MSALESLGLSRSNPGVFTERWEQGSAPALESTNPATEKTNGKVGCASDAEFDRVVRAACDSFATWRTVPAPRRGLAVRAIGEALRQKKAMLAELVSLESGKIRAEAEGEVQEMIDVADFAVGLSRQLHGVTMPSERPNHRMLEQWHPLGPIGVISAFNFPVAVWSWNALIGAVCGDSVVWKPSEKTPLTAVATTRIANDAMAALGHPPIFHLAVGAREIGARLARDPHLPLVSATGSCAMGRAVGEIVAKRLGRSLLELGGNNAAIVLDDADLDLASQAILFAAVGTTGQRCTTTRRLLVQRGVASELVRRLVDLYAGIVIGDPLDPRTHVGPLIDAEAVGHMTRAIESAKREGAEVLRGGGRIDRPGFFVEPAIVRAKADMQIVRQETFAPILYVIEVSSLEEALRVHNDVSQGLSSSIFTRDVRAAERFLSAEGSDCGIANVNLGTSGAEIGGAFGGEKDTGGGRESGSDAWKSYMRRQTCTIHYGERLELAQGIRFGSTSTRS